MVRFGGMAPAQMLISQQGTSQVEEMLQLAMGSSATVPRPTASAIQPGRPYLAASTC
ncbi:hypothetical protein OZ428_17045 [Pseudomonas sp. GXZC]|nr:hypothetical protein [Pseudomonas sp. GXZC]WAT31960.1 hypothetical protein OZ428_17045 [Pseudomonas sp. GXZC]